MEILLGPVTEGRQARLVLDTPSGDGPVDAVALVLHGGRARGNGATSRTQLAVLRMLPFAATLRRTSATAGLRVAVARLQYRVRGWNAPRRDPVLDARWALDLLAERFGDVPVGLVGHSMGGRTAMAVADAPDVVSVVGLAPWLGPEDAVGDLAGRRLLIMHGTSDRMTDPRASRAWADRARPRADAVTYVAVPGAKHAMLDQPQLWHRLAAEFTLATLGAALGRPVPVPAAVDAPVGTAAPTRQDVDSLGTGHPEVAKLLPEALAGVPFAQA